MSIRSRALCWITKFWGTYGTVAGDLFLPIGIEYTSVKSLDDNYFPREMAFFRILSQHVVLLLDIGLFDGGSVCIHYIYKWCFLKLILHAGVDHGRSADVNWCSSSHGIISFLISHFFFFPLPFLMIYFPFSVFLLSTFTLSICHFLCKFSGPSINSAHKLERVVNMEQIVEFVFLQMKIKGAIYFKEKETPLSYRELLWSLKSTWNRLCNLWMVPCGWLFSSRNHYS